MKFDPYTYSITIRKEMVDDESYFVGRVAELPNIIAFEDTYEAARAIVIDAISSFKALADKEGEEFPSPYPAIPDEFSGRITLRLPKTLHAKVSFYANQENVSINQYLNNVIAYSIGEAEGLSKAEKLMHRFTNYIVTSLSAITKSSTTEYEKSQLFYYDYESFQKTSPLVLTS